MNISLKLILGLACSFSLLTAAEQVPASIDVVDDAAPAVSSTSSSTEKTVAPAAPVTQKEPSAMVAQNLLHKSAVLQPQHKTRLLKNVWWFNLSQNQL